MKKKRITYQSNVVEGDRTQEINGEPAAYVLMCYDLAISNLFTAVIVQNCRAEHNNDVKYEYQVDCLTCKVKYLILHPECNADGQHEHIVAGCEHDQEVPVLLERTRVAYEEVLALY